MNWYQENRWLGNFLIIFGICTLGALYFVFHAKSGADEALARFNEAASQRITLESQDPYPNEANYKKVKGYLDAYAASLEKLKEDLKTRVLPAPAIAPNEFQSRLRQAMLSVSEKARANNVKLPDNFALGFEDYTAALPNTAAAPLLGQELAQLELLVNLMLDARVTSINGLKRTPLPEEQGAAAAASPTPGAGRGGAKPAATPASGTKMLERDAIDLTFTSSPSAARKVLNQIGSSSQQFFITRTLFVHNEKQKGPAREQIKAGANTAAASAASAAAAPANPATAGAAAAKPNVALNFIVGEEKIETSARVEMIRFVF